MAFSNLCRSNAKRAGKEVRFERQDHTIRPDPRPYWFYGSSERVQKKEARQAKQKQAFRKLQKNKRKIAKAQGQRGLAMIQKRGKRR